jgi:hypothetical protein
MIRDPAAVERRGVVVLHRQLVLSIWIVLRQLHFRDRDVHPVQLGEHLLNLDDPILVHHQLATMRRTVEAFRSARRAATVPARPGSRDASSHRVRRR